MCVNIFSCMHFVCSQFITVILLPHPEHEEAVILKTSSTTYQSVRRNILPPPKKKKNLNLVCEMTFEVYIRSRKLRARSCVVTGKCTRQLMQLVNTEISELLIFMLHTEKHTSCVCVCVCVCERERERSDGSLVCGKVRTFAVSPSSVKTT